MKIRSVLALVFAAALVLAACGDDDADTTDPVDDTTSDTTDDTTGEATDDTTGDTPEDMADDLADDLTDLQESQGGGSATLTVGDRTWTFDSVLCAFGEEMIGQEGAVFNLSAIQDGLQLYASIDSFGHSVSIDDISDFENPSVSLSTFGDGEFIVLDGNDVTAEVGMVDGTSDSLDETPGTLTATCP